MSIKILIDRKFKEPVSSDILKVIEDIRIKALRQRGYIGGETMVEAGDDRHLLVISLWSSIEDWQTWYKGNEWKSREKELAPHLADPVTVQVFMPAADYLKRPG